MSESDREQRPVPQRGKRYDRADYRDRLHEFVVERRRSFQEIGRRVEPDANTVRRWAIDWGWYDPETQSITAGADDPPATAPREQCRQAVAVLRAAGRSRVRAHVLAEHTIDLTTQQVGWHLQEPAFRAAIGVELWRRASDGTTYKILTEAER